KKVDIAKYVNSGENEIKLSINFTQSPDIYESIKKAAIFESEKNKLTYDTEIEAIYLVGDFSVATNGNFTELDKDAVRCDGDFTIDAPVRELSLESIEQQGLPFFAGSLKLSKTITVNTNNYCLKFDRKYANSVRVFVNGVEVKHILWRPYFVDLSDYLNIGENKIELELTNSLRNLLGPHHLEEGESYAVCPCDFFCEENIWGNKPWNDEYCFVKFGLKLN
ncbi:MAG: hypothetical protein RR145_04115, partial [Oscillospiraceae bacterium]